MPSPTPPPEFFDRVEQGDRHATAEFVDRFGPVALALLRTKFTRVTEAEREELVQEILLDVIASLPSYDRARAFKPWFLTIAWRRGQDFMDRHADEWVEGDYGKLPAHISYEQATRPDAPQDLKDEIRVATAAEAEPEAELSARDEDDEISPTGVLSEQLSALRRWTITLTPAQQALLSHYSHGWSWEEVAERLAQLGESVKPATARVRGHRLLERAKRVIGD